MKLSPPICNYRPLLFFINLWRIGIYPIFSLKFWMQSFPIFWKLVAYFSLIENLIWGKKQIKWSQWIQSLHIVYWKILLIKVLNKFFYSFTWNSVLLLLLALKPTSIEAADWQIHQKIHQSGFGLSKATNQNQTHREKEHGKACWKQVWKFWFGQEGSSENCQLKGRELPNLGEMII